VVSERLDGNLEGATLPDQLKRQQLDLGRFTGGAMIWKRKGDNFTATVERVARDVRFDLTVERASARS
jgi:hypothetical protein